MYESINDMAYNLAAEKGVSSDKVLDMTFAQEARLLYINDKLKDFTKCSEIYVASIYGQDQARVYEFLDHSKFAIWDDLGQHPVTNYICTDNRNKMCHIAAHILRSGYVSNLTKEALANNSDNVVNLRHVLHPLYLCQLIDTTELSRTTITFPDGTILIWNDDRGTWPFKSE